VVILLGYQKLLITIFFLFFFINFDVCSIWYFFHVRKNWQHCNNTIHYYHWFYLYSSCNGCYQTFLSCIIPIYWLHHAIRFCYWYIMCLTHTNQTMMCCDLVMYIRQINQFRWKCYFKEAQQCIFFFTNKAFQQVVLNHLRKMKDKTWNKSCWRKGLPVFSSTSVQELV
jgi:hypothetical protein